MLELLKANIENKLNLKGNIHISTKTANGLSIKAHYNSTQIEVNVELMENKYKLEIKNVLNDKKYDDEELFKSIDNSIRMLVISDLTKKKDMAIWDYINNHSEERLAQALLKAKGRYETKEKHFDMTGAYQNAFSTVKSTVVGEFIFRTTKKVLKVKPSHIQSATMYEIIIPIGVFYANVLLTKKKVLHMQFFFVQEAQDGIHVQVGFKDGSPSVRVVTREGY